MEEKCERETVSLEYTMVLNYPVISFIWGELQKLEHKVDCYCQGIVREFLLALFGFQITLIFKEACHLKLSLGLAPVDRIAIQG